MHPLWIARFSLLSFGLHFPSAGAVGLECRARSLGVAGLEGEEEGACVCASGSGGRGTEDGFAGNSPE